MADRSRLQVRTSLDPEVWSDVGGGSVGVPIPVDIESSALPTGAATSANQTNGSQIAKIANTLVTSPFDYIGATYPDTSTEVYTYKTGGSGGTTVAVVTVVYSDPVTKAIIASVTKT